MLSYPPFLNVPRVVTLTRLCTNGAGPLAMTFTGEPICVPVHWCSFDAGPNGYNNTPRKRTIPMACFGEECRKHDLRLDWQICVSAILELVQRPPRLPPRGQQQTPPRFRLEHSVMDLPSGCVRQLYKDFEGVFRGHRSQLCMRKGEARVTIEHLEPVVSDAELKPPLSIPEVLCARWGYPAECAQIEIDGHGRNILRFREPPKTPEPKWVAEGDGEP